MNKDLHVFGEPITGAVDQMKTAMETGPVVDAALMADHHIGYSVPIGGVIRYAGAVSPCGVGYDIGCGNKAVLLDIPAEYVAGNIKDLMNEVAKQISFGVGRSNAERVESPVLDGPGWKNPAAAPLKEMARNQLGTVGSGNHYVDIFTDELSRVWVGVHFGSRGLGHKIATYYIKQAGGKDGMYVAPVVLDEASDLGEQYIEAMKLAGDYAYAGRDWVCDKVAEILGAQVLDSVHNHHNFAWKENGLWVVRKGATPNHDGVRSFIGGSMGDCSYIVQGVQNIGDKTLYSTVHGAGRLLGRKEAKRRITTDEHRALMAGIEVRGGDIDESPLAYKRIDEVLKYHSDSVHIAHTLTPLGVAMAGSDTVDPYKD